MRPPDFVIGDASNPYLYRWHLIPKNRWVNVYLHRFLRDDDDRALHDHPWPFVSILLNGTYREILAGGVAGRWRRRFSAVFRPPTHRHRVELQRDDVGRPVTCWTLMVVGPRVREWGFWCPQGFVHWKTFTKPNAPGEVGQGCGDG